MFFADMIFAAAAYAARAAALISMLLFSLSFRHVIDILRHAASLFAAAAAACHFRCYATLPMPPCRRYATRIRAAAPCCRCLFRR